jgi:hypothetical protein
MARMKKKPSANVCGNPFSRKYDYHLETDYWSVTAQFSGSRSRETSENLNSHEFNYPKNEE